MIAARHQRLNPARSTASRDVAVVGGDVHLGGAALRARSATRTTMGLPPMIRERLPGKPAWTRGAPE